MLEKITGLEAFTTPDSNKDVVDKATKSKLTSEPSKGSNNSKLESKPTTPPSPGKDWELYQDDKLIDLCTHYSASMNLGELNIQALAICEYAKLSNQGFAIVQSDFELIFIESQERVQQYAEILAAPREENIGRGRKAILEGKPTFFAISNNRHWAILALIPDGNNGVMNAFYMNSAYGTGAEAYGPCKLVGLIECQEIITTIKDIPLKDRNKRPPIQVEHLYLNSTQQMLNNCGAVAAFNMASIAFWYQQTKQQGTTEPLHNYLGKLKYNIILAARNKEKFEIYVRARFNAIKNNSIEFELTIPSTDTVLPVQRIPMPQDYLQTVEEIVKKDQDATENQGLEVLLQYYGYDKQQKDTFIAQQRAIEELYAKAKATPAGVPPKPIDSLSKTEPYLKLVTIGEMDIVPESWHLRNLRFVAGHEDIPVLGNARDWTSIPRLAIVTGRNGSGKSQLLNYIDKRFRRIRNFKDNDVLYINDSRILDRSIGDIGGYDDSSWIFNNPSEFEKCVNTIADHFAQEIKLTDRTTKKAVKIIKDELALGKITKDKIDKDYIELKIWQAIPHEMNKCRMDSPLGFLSYIFGQYENRIKAIKERIKTKFDIFSLYNFYTTYGKDVQISFEEFAKKISSDEKERERESLLENFAKHHAGVSPIEEVNRVLRKYGFKYNVNFLNLRDHHRKLLQFEENGKPIESLRLSSGEEVIFAMMAWAWAGAFNATEGYSQTKVMLLDEPDRHLDPDLCKLFYQIIHEEFVRRYRIQVIMTTHRIDTVALSPEGDPTVGVYTIKRRNESVSIEKCHKLGAIFRMTRNLRELVGYNHKTYVEAPNDALFYEGAYNSLMSLSKKIREMIPRKGTRRYYWDLPGVGSYRILSNRYQLSFHSTSKPDEQGSKGKKGKKGKDNISGGGGSRSVIGAVARDITAYNNLDRFKPMRWKLASNVFSDPELYKPYGIIDNDYAKDQKLAQGVDSRISITKRHSLDNFLFDPFILFSVLSEDEITNLATKSRLNEIRKKDRKADKQAEVKVAIKTIVEKGKLLIACRGIKKALITKNFTDIQDHLETYFKLLFEMLLFNKFEEHDGEEKTYERMKKRFSEDGHLCSRPLKTPI